MGLRVECVTWVVAVFRISSVTNLVAVFVLQRSLQVTIIPYIRQAAKEFRVQNPEVVTIKGWVNILERESRSGPGGLVRIHSRIDGRPRSVRVTLDTASYNEAIEAHKKEGK